MWQAGLGHFGMPLPGPLPALISWQQNLIKNKDNN